MNGDPSDGTNALVVRDDAKAAMTHAEQLRSAHEFPTLAGSATLPFITDYYQIGDRVKIIQGRNANLQINVGVDQGEAPTYPWVTAFAWDFQGDKQQTVIQFSDRRGAAGSLMNDLRILRDRQEAASAALDRQDDLAPYGSAAAVCRHRYGNDLPDQPGRILCLRSAAADRLRGRGCHADIHARHRDDTVCAQCRYGHPAGDDEAGDSCSMSYGDPAGDDEAGDSFRRRPLGFQVRRVNFRVFFFPSGPT